MFFVDINPTGVDSDFFDMTFLHKPRSKSKNHYFIIKTSRFMVTFEFTFGIQLSVSNVGKIALREKAHLANYKECIIYKQISGKNDITLNKIS